MESQNKTLDTGYRPRVPQKLIHNAVKDNRFVVVVAHRRMGKTVSAINQLIHSALTCTKKEPRYAYVAPTYNQSKRIAMGSGEKMRKVGSKGAPTAMQFKEAAKTAKKKK